MVVKPILLVSTKGNVLRREWRIWILMLRHKGLMSPFNFFPNFLINAICMPLLNYIGEETEIKRLLKNMTLIK